MVSSSVPIFTCSQVRTAPTPSLASPHDRRVGDSRCPSGDGAEIGENFPNLVFGCVDHDAARQRRHRCSPVKSHSRLPAVLEPGDDTTTAGQAAISAGGSSSRAVRSRLAPSCGPEHNSGNADWGGTHMPDGLQESRTLLRAERERAATALSDLPARLADLDRAIETLGSLAGGGCGGHGDGRRGGRPAAARGQGRSGARRPRQGTTTAAIAGFLTDQGRTAVHATQILEHLQSVGTRALGQEPQERADFDPLSDGEAGASAQHRQESVAEDPWHVGTPWPGSTPLANLGMPPS